MNQTRTLSVSMVLATAVLAGCGEEPQVPPTGPVEPQAGAVVPAMNKVSTDEQSSAEQQTLPRIDLAGIEAIRAEAVEKGQVLVIDFWATWCVPCVETFPEIHGGLAEMGDRVRAMSVSIDGKGREQAARTFLKEQHALEDGYFMPDPAEQERTVDGLGERWTNVVVPAILVFDPKGELVGEWAGENFVGDVPAKILALARETARDPGN